MVKHEAHHSLTVLILVCQSLDRGSRQNYHYVEMVSFMLPEKWPGAQQGTAIIATHAAGGNPFAGWCVFE
eukprot:1139732-Pelagomonas_calceolata.AAC.5